MTVKIKGHRAARPAAVCAAAACSFVQIVISTFPRQGNVWVVPLLFRELTYAIYKLEGPAKVRKLEGLRDVVFFDDVPPIDLLLKYREILTFERGRPSPARNVGLGRKARHLRLFYHPPARRSAHFLLLRLRLSE
jgi:hypothetical protein